MNTILLERVSPEVIFLRPPEKLVIEIKATGRYRNIQWTKNGARLTIQPEQFPNFNEILIYSTTTQEDIGLYEISASFNPILQLLSPSELDFNVITPGMKSKINMYTRIVIVITMVVYDQVTVSNYWARHIYHAVCGLRD